MKLISGFQPNTEVAEARYLFGHREPDGLLDGFINRLTMGTNTQLLGERRIGKTSLMKCALRQMQASALQSIPVYLNFRAYNRVRGYENAHRLLLAAIHCAIIRRLPGDLSCEVINTSGLPCEGEPEEIFELLKAATIYEVEKYLGEYIEKLKELKYGIVLLLDEYESMMISTFEGISGSFFLIRDLSSEGPLTWDAPKPLTYVIAGSTPWQRFCERFGSPDFNNTSDLLYVSPINEQNFAEMWSVCLEESSETVRDRVQGSIHSPAEVFHLTGGWPFYGKLVGQLIASEGRYDEELVVAALSQHFTVSWARLIDEHLQQGVLDQAVIKPSELRDLTKRGLLRPNLTGDGYEPNGKLWKRFVEEHSLDFQRTTTKATAHVGLDETLVNQVELLAQNVIDLVISINETCHNYGQPMIFTPTNDDLKIYGYLRTPAGSRSAFGQFATGLYLLIFERTIAIENGKSRSIRLGLLPEGYRRNRVLIQEIDALRHEFGDAHLTHVETWKPGKDALQVADVLEKYLGSRAAPSGEQFLALQTKILSELGIYLETLQSFLMEAYKNGIERRG